MVKLKRISDFLTGDDVNDGDIIVILKEPLFRSKEETGFRSDSYLLEVLLPDGRIMSWTPNKTTFNELLDAYGDESKNWLNEKVLCDVREQIVMGTKKRVIYGHPVKETQVVETLEKPTTPSPAKEPTQSSAQPSSQQEALQLTPEAFEAIRVNADIIAAGLPLNANDFNMFPAKARLELLKRKLVERRDEFYWFTEAASSFLR